MMMLTRETPCCEVSMKEISCEKRSEALQCLHRIREGDQAAFATLMELYAPLIGAETARRAAGLCTQDVEDLQQVAALALYRAALGFDLEQNEVEFGLYAKVCISNALNSQLRVIRRYLSEISVQDDVFLREIGEDPAKRVMEQEAAQALCARVRNLLSPYENRVWTLFVTGRSAREIAALLQKDTHSIENAVYRIRQKLRRALSR